jgi:hypothetical protein
LQRLPVPKDNAQVIGKEKALEKTGSTSKGVRAH